MPDAPGFTRFDLLTGWLPIVVVLLGLLLSGALLAVHPERLSPLALALVGGCTSICLLGAWVLLLGWL